jgi:hypothetical protein
MSGSQFAPYEPEYIKLWQERMAEKPAKPVKPTKVKPKAKRKGKAKK